MSFLYLFLLFFMSSSAINRDIDFVLCGTKKACHPHLLIGVSNPTLNKLPCLFVRTHRKLFSSTIYRPRPNVFLPLLLLLSGDVSLNLGPTISNRIRMATVNVRSIRQKSASFSDLVTTKSLDVVAITETWLKAKETSAALADITPQGYSLIHKPRRGKQGGGVAIMTNNKFDVSSCKTLQYTSFESVGCKISAPLFSAHVVCIYRLIKYPLFFFDQFQNLLENLSSSPGELIILGDFNLHLDIPSHHTEALTDILTSFRLLQHVNFPTHIHGHWLDLCITRSASQILSSIFPSDGLSDHLTVIAELQSDLHRHTAKKQITYRRINQIDINNFKTDIVK